jgi:hypothetical protein
MARSGGGSPAVEWQTCGRDVALADSVTLRTHVPANWVHLGEVKLTAGKHRFELQLTAAAGEKKTAAFDAFLLTTGTFQPRGKLKPGQRSGLADPGFFAWEPQADPFDRHGHARPAVPERTEGRSERLRESHRG